jgi:hypothetical protein
MSKRSDDSANVHQTPVGESNPHDTLAWTGGHVFDQVNYGGAPTLPVPIRASDDVVDSFGTSD